MRVLYLPVSGPVVERDLTLAGICDVLGTDSLRMIKLHAFASLLMGQIDKSLPVNNHVKENVLISSIYLDHMRGDAFLVSDFRGELKDLYYCYQADNWNSVLTYESRCDYFCDIRTGPGENQFTEILASAK